MYADDIQLYFNCDDVSLALPRLESCFNQIQLWARMNYLKLNQNKTKMLIVSNKSTKFLSTSITLNKETLMLDTVVKNLGFSIDNNLNYNNQINRVCRYGFFMLRNLWKISSKLQQTSLKIQIVQSCILSHIDYCNSLYFKLPQKQVKKLQKLMNAGVRFIFKLRLSDRISITPYLKKCHFLPVKARIDFKICLLVYKCLNNMGPSYLTDLLQRKSSLPSLRVHGDNSLLHVPRYETANYKDRKFSFSAPMLWNKLPRNVRESNSLDIFKSRLKTHLFNVSFED